MLSVNISVIVIITIKNVDYRCIIHNISKSEAISLFKKSVLLGIYIKILSEISVILRHFLFSIYKVADIMDIYKSLNSSIGAIMKNPVMLIFVSDHLKTEKWFKHAVKNLPYLLRHVPAQYKTQQMCDTASFENGGTFLTSTKIKKCVIKHLIITLIH